MKKKPNTQLVMTQIIQQVRQTFPFDKKADDLCHGTCNQGCPLKLLEYMEMQLEDWEDELVQNKVPTFGDLQKRAKISRKIYAILEKNQLV